MKHYTVFWDANKALVPVKDFGPGISVTQPDADERLTLDQAEERKAALSKKNPNQSFVIKDDEDKFVY